MTEGWIVIFQDMTSPANERYPSAHVHRTEDLARAAAASGHQVSDVT